MMWTVGMAKRDEESEGAGEHAGQRLHDDNHANAARALNGDDGQGAHRPRPQYQPQDAEERM